MSVFTGKFYPKYILITLILFSCLAMFGFTDLFNSLGNNKKTNFTDLKIFDQTVVLINQRYLKPEWIKPKEMFKASLQAIQRQVPELMIDLDKFPKKIKVRILDNRKEFELGKHISIWTISFTLKQILKFIEDKIPNLEEPEKIEYAAIAGLVSVLDPHSAFMIPEVFREMKLGTRGEFGGLGIVISIRNGVLTIISPIEGTPAFRAGLKAQDVITRIEDESTVSMSLNQAVNRMRGKPGTFINIYIMRKGFSEPKKTTLKRAVIKIKSIKSKLLPGDIGYFRIKAFQENTQRDFKAHLTKLETKSKKLKGLIIDMRDNPGGLLDQAIKVSDNFLSKGMIVITEGIGGKHRDEKSATADGTLQNYPLVVLVNSGSASASEIVAGAIKNNERGLVIGAQTFGKGSVQMLYDFSDESALKLTVAEYLTPGDQSIQSVGITPDVQLEPIRIKKDDIHIGAEKMLPRETDLKNYLSTSKLKKSQALESLVFLEKNHKTDEEKVVDEKIREDFPIKLAEKIIKCSAQADRMAQLKSCKSVFEQTKMEQEKKIVQAFKKVGIDWSKGVSSQKVSAQVSYKIVDPTPPPITAGEEIKIKVTVKNTGKGTFFRLYGVTNSEYYIFRGKEFVFGKLSPGQEKTREISVKIPQDAMQRTDPVKLSFHELNKNTPEKVKFNVPIQALGRPSISFNYLMDDCCSGNCNGKIDKGERIGLVFVIKSNGGGEFQELVSSIKNLEGKSVYIEKGRVKLDKLKPGAFAVARFTVKVKKDYIKDNLKMRFFITDNKLLEQYMQTINLKVNKSSNSATKSKGKCLKGKKLAISQMDMPWQSPQISIAHLLKNQPNSTLSIPISGLVKNRLAIKDVMIFANEKKVFYQKGSNSPKNGGKNFQLPFSATIPLEEGKNFINIIARQTDDLAMRRSLVVYREKVE